MTATATTLGPLNLQAVTIDGQVFGRYGNFLYPRCPKCEGEGIIQGFARVAGGQCFPCRGRGVLDTKMTEQQAVTYAGKVNATRRREKNAHRAHHNARLAEARRRAAGWRAANQDVIAFLEGLGEEVNQTDPHLWQTAKWMREVQGQLDPEQTARVRAAMATGQY